MICYQVGGDPVRIMWSVRKTTTENYCTQGIPLGEVLELFLKDVCSRFENIVSDIFISGLVSMSRTTHNTKTFWCFAVVCDNSPLPPQKKLLMWNMSLRSSSSDTRRRSVARFQGLGGKISFWGWKIFVFILCFSQIFVGATKFLGELQARRQDLAAGGPKNQKGSHIFKILYWMCAATRGPNVKWGSQISNGGLGTTDPPLAKALTNCSEDIALLIATPRSSAKSFANDLSTPPFEQEDAANKEQPLPRSHKVGYRLQQRPKVCPSPAGRECISAF